MTLQITGYGYQKHSFTAKDKAGNIKSCKSVSAEECMTSFLKNRMPAQIKKNMGTILNIRKNWEQIVGNKYAKFCEPMEIQEDKLSIIAYNSSIEYYGTKKEALESLNSLINCKNCTNCSYCENCINGTEIHGG